MQWLDRIKRVKIALVIAALLIAMASLAVSHFLVKDMEKEEYARMEIWAEAMRSLNRADETTGRGGHADCQSAGTLFVCLGGRRP